MHSTLNDPLKDNQIPLTLDTVYKLALARIRYKLWTKTVLWNRNRTVGTVTFCLRGTGTVMKGNHKSSHRHSIKLCIRF